MDDAMRMSIVDRLANAHERLQESRPRQRVVLSSLSAAVVVGDRLTQSLPTDQPHGVERLSVLRAMPELVHRNNVRMFELARDFRLFQKPPPNLRLSGAFRLDLLERHVPVQVVVAGDPDLTESALSV